MKLIGWGVTGHQVIKRVSLCLQIEQFHNTCTQDFLNHFANYGKEGRVMGSSMEDIHLTVIIWPASSTSMAYRKTRTQFIS